MKKLICKMLSLGMMVMLALPVMAATSDYKTLYQSKVKALNNLSNIEVTGQYIAEMDGNHNAPELVVAVTELGKDGMPVKYPFYVFTIQNGKLVRLKNESNVYSGSDMGENVNRSIVTNSKGDSLIKEVVVNGPMLDGDFGGQYATYVFTDVTYLKYVQGKGLVRYLSKVSHMKYDNADFDTSGKGTYALDSVQYMDEEITQAKFNQLIQGYK